MDNSRPLSFRNYSTTGMTAHNLDGKDTNEDNVDSKEYKEVRNALIGKYKKDM